MNYLKKTILLLTLISSSTLSANWPESGNYKSTSVFSSGMSKNSLENSFYKKRQNHSVKHSASALSLTLGQLNTAFITGGVLNKKSKFNIFEWDFKVKLRLNRNLNIIFTYN